MRLAGRLKITTSSTRNNENIVDLLDSLRWLRIFPLLSIPLTMATIGSASFFLQFFCTDPICLSFNMTDDESKETRTKKPEEICNDDIGREEKKTLGYVVWSVVRCSK